MYNGKKKNKISIFYIPNNSILAKEIIIYSTIGNIILPLRFLNKDMLIDMQISAPHQQTKSIYD